MMRPVELLNLYSDLAAVRATLFSFLSMHVPFAVGEEGEEDAHIRLVNLMALLGCGTTKLQDIAVPLPIVLFISSSDAVD